MVMTVHVDSNDIRDEEREQDRQALQEEASEGCHSNHVSRF